jgi:hypothetical protein
MNVATPGQHRRRGHPDLPADRRVRYPVSGKGQRNRALYTAAIALGQLAAGHELTAVDVTSVLEHAAARAGLTRREAARTIASGLRAGAARPRTVAA